MATPAKTDPRDPAQRPTAQPDPAQPDPAKSDPAQSDPAQPDLAQPDPARPTTRRSSLSRPEPSAARPAPEGARPTPQRGARTRERQRASHSLDAVLTEAVTLLDESGEAGLTFRALAARLGGGVASIYWYVSSKDELLDRAADHVLGDVLASVRDVGTADPIADLRTIAVTLFDAIVDRPWLSSYFMRDTGVQPNALWLYEQLGEQALRLDLTARQRFHAVSAVVGFVVGTAADMSQEPPAVVRSGELRPEEHLAGAIAQWRALDPEQFPFLHHVVDEFAAHDDSEQFRAGLDLLLDGLRRQAHG